MLSANNFILGEGEIPGGTLVFRGKRVPCQAPADSLAGGKTLDEFLDDLPTLTGQAVAHALEHAQAFLVRELG